MKNKKFIIVLLFLLIGVILFVNQQSKEISAPNGDIYLAQKKDGIFQKPEIVPYPISSKCAEDNPSPGDDGTLYFDSSREDPLGQNCLEDAHKRIWSSSFIGGKWTTPEFITDGWTAFVTDGGNTLYYSGGDFLQDGRCFAGSCIWKKIKTNNEWGAPQLIAWSDVQQSDKHQIVISEPSLTQNGKYMYFVYYDAYGSGGAVNTQIGVASKDVLDVPVGRIIKGLNFSDDWGTAYNLPSPVNTDFGDDSVWISADGKNLYFAYTGPDLPERKGQHGKSYDIYIATIEGNSWVVENLDKINSKNEQVSDAAQGLSRDGEKLFFTRWIP